MINISQGDTLKIQFREKNESGNYLPISGYSNIIAYVYNKAGLIYKYSSIPTTGYSTIIIDNSTTCHFWIDSNMTKTFKEGLINVEIMGKGSNSSELPTGSKLIYRIINNININSTKISSEI